MKRRSQLEEALKASGAPPDALRMLNGEFEILSFTAQFLVQHIEPMRVTRGMGRRRNAEGAGGDVIVRHYSEWKSGSDPSGNRTRFAQSSKFTRRAGRCHWYAGFLGDIPFPQPFHSVTAPQLNSALRTSLLKAAQISSLTHHFAKFAREREREGERGREILLILLPPATVRTRHILQGALSCILLQLINPWRGIRANIRRFPQVSRLGEANNEGGGVDERRGGDGVASGCTREIPATEGRVQWGHSRGFSIWESDDAADRRVFSGVTRSPRSCIPATALNTHLAPPSSALNTSIVDGECLWWLPTEGAGEHRVSSDQSESPYPRQPASHVAEPPSDKQWNYSGLDLMGSGAAFWQNYSGE
ncbi:hypothetical protein PR048_022831 [Dryococelus australis]|uniref:Uncharacterized protein n=1 Tax=Dryococelus australis TaxID=614101 RepID=A0ABQ9GSG2_9NEOP|nr:hypothetical protein PR048_022831 [Dryococelus australis]